MDHLTASRTLSALAHEHRLAVFRALIAAGPSGLAAGELARGVGIGATNLSFHIKELERAGLVRSWRVGRSIRSNVEVDAVRRLLEFLIADCCGGKADLCGGIFVEVSSLCCGSAEVSNPEFSS